MNTSLLAHTTTIESTAIGRLLVTYEMPIWACVRTDSGGVVQVGGVVGVTKPSLEEYLAKVEERLTNTLRK